MIVFASLGLLVSIYMTLYKILDNSAMCLGSGDCATVNASRYAEVRGIPVAFIGVLGYAALLGLVLFEGRLALLRENGAMLFFGTALTGFLFTLWLIYVEFALIRAFCPFCLASQAAMTVLFVLSIVRLARQFRA
jgi:uncharacterized membrane protein